MTRAPLLWQSQIKNFQRGNTESQETTIGWRFTNEELGKCMGSIRCRKPLKMLPKDIKIMWEGQDLFAFESQQRAKKAMEK